MDIRSLLVLDGNVSVEAGGDGSVSFTGGTVYVNGQQVTQITGGGGFGGGGKGGRHGGW